jgi:hypothetical protein
MVVVAVAIGGGEYTVAVWESVRSAHYLQLAAGTHMRKSFCEAVSYNLEHSERHRSKGGE